MLKAQELLLQRQMDSLDKNNELRVKAQADSFNSEIKELRMVAKQRNVLLLKTSRQCEKTLIKSLKR